MAAIYSITHVVCTLLALFYAAVLSLAAGSNSQCRSVPGDAEWPDASAWSALNNTIGGRLLATVPLAAPCHAPNYDAQRCAFLQEQWRFAPIQ
jgi:hypothetical protein